MDRGVRPTRVVENASAYSDVKSLLSGQSSCRDNVGNSGAVDLVLHWAVAAIDDSDLPMLVSALGGASESGGSYLALATVLVVTVHTSPAQ